MLNSMTAYGRASIVASFGRLVVEIQSVNRRFLEVSVSLPREMGHFEMDVRRWISEVVERGQVTVRVEAVFEAEAPLRATPNIPLVKQLKSAWDQVVQAIELPMPPASFYDVLARQSDIVSFVADHSDENKYHKALEGGIQQALLPFLAMRRQEGAALMADVSMRLQLLREGLERISERSGQATERYRKKLIARIADLVPGATESDDRILREICLFAERVDVTEEIIRFRSHLKQFDETMDSDKPGVGKTLDFLLQELLREVNTIGSKAMDSEVATDVVGLKAELERIREQLQNVE